MTDRLTNLPWMKLKVHKCNGLPKQVLGQAIKQDRLQQQELRLVWVSEQLVSNNKVLSISSRAS